MIEVTRAGAGRGERPAKQVFFLFFQEGRGGVLTLCRAPGSQACRLLVPVRNSSTKTLHPN